MSTCSATSSHLQRIEYSTSLNINLLPIELLILIFSLVMSPSKQANGQFHLASVCRYWRRIVFENSKFWTTMTFQSRCSSNPEYMELVSRKSGSRGLILFGPSATDIENNPANWVLFHGFLQSQSSRIKTLLLDGLPEYPDDDSDDDQTVRSERLLPGLMDLAFENLQVLSIMYSDVPQIDFKTAVPNLQELQITCYSELPSELPPHLKKLSLRVLFNHGVLSLLLGTKELEYLLLYGSYRLPQMTLPKLRTLKLDNFIAALDVLSAPALTHLEVAAPEHFPTANPGNVCRFVDKFDLSRFTHLYIGYTPSILYDPDVPLEQTENPIDGCIWASLGPMEIPCCLGQPTIFKGYDHTSTELPSSWSTSSPDDKPLLHVHTLKTYNFTKNGSILPWKLITRMESLETLVLCFPDTPYPPCYDLLNRDPEPYNFHLPQLFQDIANYASALLHIIIRSGSFQKDSDDINMLSECFYEEIWTEDSCPLLESITYHAPSPRYPCRDSRFEFWQTWIRFIHLRQECGHPLKLLRIIGAYPPSPSALKKLEEYSEFTKVVIEDADDSAFYIVHWKSSRYTAYRDPKHYPMRGF